MVDANVSLRRALGAGLIACIVVPSSWAAQTQVAGPADVQEKQAPAVLPAPPPKKSPAPRHRSQERRPPLRELTAEQVDALAVLDALIVQARSIDDEATRIRVESRIAEVLFERDPERARKLYRRLFDDIEGLNESAVDDSVAPVGARLTLRVELLATLYGVDPVLAAQLSSTLDEDPENYDGGGMPFENQSDMSATMLRVAQSLVSTDPELAASLARQGIKDGVPVEFAILLPALGNVNRPAADQLATDAVRIAGAGGSSLVDVAGALPYVFPELESNEPRPLGASTRSNDLRSALLIAALNVAGRYANGLNARLGGGSQDAVEPWSIYGGEGLAVNYQLAEQMAPLFDSVEPDRSGAFRGLTAQIANAMPVEVRSSMGTSVPKSSVESAESVAAKAETITNVQIRDEFYGRAATLAADRGDVDLAKSYAARIADAGRMSSVRTTIALQAIRKALAERRYDDARKLSREIADVRERASAYTQVAFEMAAIGKRAMAADCLEEAQVAIVKEEAVMTRDKAEALVRVANACAALDPARAFEMMRTAVDAVNTGLRRFESQGAAPQAASQLQMRQNPGRVFQIAALDPSSGLELLARVDYFRAMGLAQRFEAKALAVLAQLGVVRGVLRVRSRGQSDAPAPGASPEPAAKPTVKPAATVPAETGPPKPETAP